jgi:hypothetical protein
MGDPVIMLDVRLSFAQSIEAIGRVANSSDIKEVFRRQFRDGEGLLAFIRREQASGAFVGGITNYDSYWLHALEAHKAFLPPINASKKRKTAPSSIDTESMQKYRSIVTPESKHRSRRTDLSQEMADDQIIIDKFSFEDGLEPDMFSQNDLDQLFFTLR